MNIKIQGGGSGKYANKGSSFGCMNYLNHENEQMMAEKGQIEPFFGSKVEKKEFAEMVTELDQNKAKLGRNDAKFFVLTISPSEQEQKAMGGTEAEQSKNMKDYTRNVMNEYAKSFGKGLEGKDLLYYGKIHHNRGEKEGMHAHVVVSRKDLENRIKLSPKTNHRNVERSGTVKSGFDRTNFFKECENVFDRQFNHERQYSQSFEYQNAMKNGTIQEKQKAVQQNFEKPMKELDKGLSREQEFIQDNELSKGDEFIQSQNHEKSRDKGLSLDM